MGLEQVVSAATQRLADIHTFGDTRKQEWSRSVFSIDIIHKGADFGTGQVSHSRYRVTHSVHLENSSVAGNYQGSRLVHQKLDWWQHGRLDLTRYDWSTRVGFGSYR